MTNDLVPAPEGSLERFVKSLNLPEILAGPAGKAIARLVAGVVEIPAAYLDDFAQSIKNKTKAKELVNSEVAQAAAKLAANDTDIVARAAYNLLAKEYRRQKNKEDIARRTVEILEVTPTPHEEDHKPGYVDDDWLNVFERYAEDASSDRMKELWARILAGQIRRPKKFSLQTLRFVAELDEPTAKLFQDVVPRVVAGDFIPYAETEGQQFSNLLTLEDAGLVSGTGGSLGRLFNNLRPGSSIMLPYVTRAVIVQFRAEVQRLHVIGAFLTRVGREIYSLLDSHESVEIAKSVADKFPKGGVSQIIWAEKVGAHFIQREVLWKAPEDQASAPNQPTA